MEHRQEAVASGRETGATASILQTTGAQRDLVCDARRKRMADAAARFSALATLLLLLREVAPDGSLGAAQ
jgi:hypothetical protein